MSALIIDASVAIKWVVQEPGTAEALAIRRGGPLAAPDLIVAECANILWKKVSRGEMASDQAILAARLLQRADIELVPTLGLMADAVRLAIELDHPAYDCAYMVLALERRTQLVTADDRLFRKVSQTSWAPRVLALA